MLFQCLTGQNLSTICNLTSDFSRADGYTSGETNVLITRGSKPRRGPNRSEMDLTFAGNGPRESDDLRDDFSSPFGLYLIAEELCRRARTFAASHALLVGFSHHNRSRSDGGLGFRSPGESCLKNWKGWLPDDVPQRVDSRRLRRTFLELHQRPVAQTKETLADTYLLRDPGALEDNQHVVGRVLSSEVDRIQIAAVASVITDEDICDAATDSLLVAAKFGITEEQLQMTLDGRLDTVATACIDNADGPYTLPGKPCTASFLLCLGCPNARSEPRHIPIQALLYQRISERRMELSNDEWDQTYGSAAEQLEDLLRQQGVVPAEAAALATVQDSELIEALLDGKLDLL